MRIPLPGWLVLLPFCAVIGVLSYFMELLKNQTMIYNILKVILSLFVTVTIIIIVILIYGEIYWNTPDNPITSEFGRYFRRAFGRRKRLLNLK